MWKAATGVSWVGEGFTLRIRWSHLTACLAGARVLPCSYAYAEPRTITPPVAATMPLSGMKDTQVAARDGTPLTGRPGTSQRTALDRFWNNGSAAYRTDLLDVAGEPHGLRPWCRIPKIVASGLPVRARANLVSVCESSSHQDQVAPNM
jgi:hypothetical protein